MNLVNDGRLNPLGYQQITDVSSSVGLTLPAGFINRAGAVAMVQALDQDVRWRDDAVAPTATVGMLLAAGETLVYNGDYSAIRFIEVSSGAELNVSYYQAVGNI